MRGDYGEAEGAASSLVFSFLFSFLLLRLTAFVAKAFGQAKCYIYVYEKHIENAVDWLRKHQLPSGCFQSVGRLFNNALKVRNHVI